MKMAVKLVASALLLAAAAQANAFTPPTDPPQTCTNGWEIGSCKDGWEIGSTAPDDKTIHTDAYTWSCPDGWEIGGTDGWEIGGADGDAGQCNGEPVNP